MKRYYCIGNWMALLSLMVFFNMALLAAESITTPAKQELPKGVCSEPKTGNSVDLFTLGAGETHVGGWGAYSPNERRFFDEFLPALFERTLVVNGPTTKRDFVGFLQATAPRSRSSMMARRKHLN